MTDEVPQMLPRDPVYCRRCHRDVVVERSEGQFKLVCGCETLVIDTMGPDLPAEWSG